MAVARGERCHRGPVCLLHGLHPDGMGSDQRGGSAHGLGVGCYITSPASAVRFPHADGKDWGRYAGVGEESTSTPD